MVNIYEQCDIFHKCAISKGSCGEVRSQSYKAFDWRYISENQFNELMEQTDKLSRKTSNLMAHLKTSPRKGTKYT